MSNELPRGLIVKDKHPNAPDFIVCKVSVKIDEFIQTLQSNNNNGWCNLEFCRSRDGKLYPKFDTFKPEQGQRQAPQQPAPQAPPPPPPFTNNGLPQGAGLGDNPSYQDQSIDDIPY